MAAAGWPRSARRSTARRMGSGVGAGMEHLHRRGDGRRSEEGLLLLYEPAKPAVGIRGGTRRQEGRHNLLAGDMNRRTPKRAPNPLSSFLCGPAWPKTAG